MLPGFIQREEQIRCEDNIKSYNYSGVKIWLGLSENLTKLFRVLFFFDNRENCERSTGEISTDWKERRCDF